MALRDERGRIGDAAHRHEHWSLPPRRRKSSSAVAWFKGSLPLEIEERTRTVRAANFLGR